MLQNTIKRLILLRIQAVFKPGLLERISYIAVLAVLKYVTTASSHLLSPYTISRLTILRVDRHTLISSSHLRDLKYLQW
jgi:hypothetical protein